MSRQKTSSLRTLLRLLGFAKKYWVLGVVMFVLMGLYSALYQGRVILAKPLFDDALSKFDWILLRNLSL
ncbi:MAG: hypothetical protein RDV41_00325, partial [Planctomycetota bacterium]|nr:hypothetical protein [Planctomycetota bacterium]